MLLWANQLLLANVHSIIKRVPGNAVEIFWRIRRSDMLVCLAQNSDCNGNDQEMARRTTHWCLGCPMTFAILEFHKLPPCILVEQAKIGSNHMDCVVPRKPTWMDWCVTGATYSELSRLVGRVDPIVAMEIHCLLSPKHWKNDLWMFESCAPLHWRGSCLVRPTLNHTAWGWDFFDYFACLIVHDGESDYKPFWFYHFIYLFVCSKNYIAAETGYGEGQDSIGLAVIHYKETYVTLKRHEWECSGKVVI